MRTSNLNKLLITDFLLKIKVILLLMLIEPGISYPQSSSLPIKPVWVKSFSGDHSSNSDAARCVAVDNSGNSYVAGSMWISGVINGVIVKYNSAGDSLWSQLQTPGEWNDIKVDNSGNAYVTGGGFRINKYSSLGVQEWARQYAGDYAYDIEVDNSGNVYVSGQSTASGGVPEISTIKYDPLGNQLWVKKRIVKVQSDGPVLSVDNTGNVYVASGAGNMDFVLDLLLIKYNSSGVQQWEQIYAAGPPESDDFATSIQIDNQQNILIGGVSENNFIVLKYNPAGVQQWVYNYNATGPGYANLNASAVDAAGNFYIGGHNYDPDRRFTVFKVSSSGNLLWINKYSIGGPGFSIAYDLALDASGNCYATGSVNTGFFDCLTIKYSPDGTVQWVQKFNGPSGTNDAAFSIAVDLEGNSIIAGEIKNLSTPTGDFGVIKYSNRYRPPGGGTIGYRNFTQTKFEQANTNTGNNIESDKNGALQVPDKFELHQNYPNPFNPTTEIDFAIPVSGFVSLKVYALTGKEVWVVVNEFLNEGNYRYSFDATGLASGVYFYTMSAGEFKETKMMSVVK